MLKRNVVVIVVAGLVLGGATFAWASGAPERPSVASATQSVPPTPEERKARREALRACLRQAGENEAARRACFSSAGGHRPGAGPGAGPRDGHRHAPLRLLGRAVHGTVVVPGENGGWQTLTFDRGTVNEATDQSKIVLDRPDGQSATLALTGDTKYHGVESAAGITEGRPATVVSRDGKALHVVHKERSRRRGNN